MVRYMFMFNWQFDCLAYGIGQTELFPTQLIWHCHSGGTRRLSLTEPLVGRKSRTRTRKAGMKIERSFMAAAGTPHRPPVLGTIPGTDTLPAHQLQSGPEKLRGAHPLAYEVENCEVMHELKPGLLRRPMKGPLQAQLHESSAEYDSRHGMQMWAPVMLPYNHEEGTQIQTIM
jgi:hypothetical protein